MVNDELLTPPALLLARLAEVSYRVNVGQPKPPMPYGFQLANVIDNAGTGTQASAGHPKLYRQPADKRVLILAFRGTEPLKFRDWLTDANHQVVSYDGTNQAIGVHAGFIAAYKSVCEAMRNLVGQIRPEAVYATGHSLGGALAALCALDLRFHYPDLVVNCTTFGAPRIGNQAFAESYQRRVLHNHFYVNRYDIMPRLPARRDGYEDIVSLIELRPERFKWLRIVLGAWDHRMINYIEALAAQKAKRDECC